MGSNYPYIIAGLPYLLQEIEPDTAKEEDGENSCNLLQELNEQLSEGDLRLARLVSMGCNQGPLSHHFYNKVAKSENQFIKDYFSFDAELRNIATAYMAKKYGMKPDFCHIGDESLLDALQTPGNELNIGQLSPISGQMERIMQIENPLLREKELDMLRWNKAEELAAFHSLDIEVILAFIIHFWILRRWQKLDTQKGKALFRQFVKQIKDTYIPKTK